MKLSKHKEQTHISQGQQAAHTEVKYESIVLQEDITASWGFHFVNFFHHKYDG